MKEKIAGFVRVVKARTEKNVNNDYFILFNNQ